MQANVGLPTDSTSLDPLGDHPFFRWLLGQERVLRDRLDRLQKQFLTLRAYEKARAKLCWEQDRGLDAEELGATLARRPAAVRAKLARDKHGALWLIRSWKALLAILDREPAWDDKRKALAFDLLGVVPALRQGEPWEAVGLDWARALADREIAALEGRPIHPSPALKALIREESACWRRFQAIQKEILTEAKRIEELSRRDDAPMEPAPAVEDWPPLVAPASASARPLLAASMRSNPSLGNHQARGAAL